MGLEGRNMVSKFNQGTKEIEKRNLKCPHCKKVFGVEVVTKVVDDLAYSEARGIQDSGKYFRFKCPHCGQVHYHEHEMLYISSKHGQEWAIEFVPSKDDAIEKAYEYDELRKNKGTSADYIFYRVRLVWELDDFCEKLMIASNEFDDRPIEMLKCLVKNELAKAKFPEVVKQSFFTPDRHNFAIMNEFKNGKGYAFEIKKEHYEQALKKIMNHPIMKTDNDYIVDQEMIDGFFGYEDDGYYPVHERYELEEDDEE